MRTTITDKLLRRITAQGEPHEPIWDQSLCGFGARIGAQGGVSFFAMARRRAGDRRPIRLSVGRYPTLSLVEARDRARLLLRDLQDGVDPRARKAAELEAETAAHANRFDSVAESFIRRHIFRIRTSNTVTLLIRRELVATWKQRPITSITKRDVTNLIDGIVDRGHPEAARQAFTYVRRLFRWAISRGFLEHSPCDHLNARDLIAAAKPRQRVLSELELRLVWKAAAQTPYPVGPFVQLLALLGVRRSELARATWDEFDLDGALWTIPAQRMKSDEAHTVPLPQPAVAILRDLPHFASGIVFSARGTCALNDFSAVKTRIDDRIAALNGGEPIAPWTFHDLRRTFRTGLSALGIAPHIAELAIAHRQAGLARVYDLHRFEAEKRHALNRWSAHLLRIVESRRDRKVVALRSAAE